MRRLSTIAILFLTLAFEVVANAQGPSHPSEAVLKGRPDNVRVDVSLGKEFKTITGIPIGGLYVIDKDGNEVELVPLPLTIPQPYRTFTVTFPKDRNAVTYNPELSYELLVLAPSVSTEGRPITIKKVIKVKEKFTVELRRDDDACNGGIQIRITTPLRESAIWIPVYEWLDYFKNGNPSGIATVKIREAENANDKQYTVDSIDYFKTDLQKLAGILVVCLKFKEALPRKDFDAKLEFQNPKLPPEISAAADENMSAAFSAELPKDEDITEPEKRGLERNLDLGLTFTSEVVDEKIPATNLSPEMIVRKRTSRGVIDLRFAPWIDVFHPVIRPNRWINFLTPIFINANVATGKIEKETLGLNRVLIGLEGESRYYKSQKDKASGYITYPIWHRVVWGATHASDRDFKQKEITGKLEYRPVFDKLYRPYSLNYFYDKDGFKHQRSYGFAFLPMAGLEMGRTYSRRRPAPAIEPSATVRRFYFGGEIKVDLSAYVTLSVQDFLYVRGENPQDHFKNYFKGSGEFRLGRSSNGQFGHSLFMVFERGQQPPFASPDVNSFRIGYRIQGSYCGDHCR